jgi:hypothetical protein
LRHAIEKAEVLVPALRARPNLAHFRVDDLDRRPEAFAQCVIMIGDKRRIGSGNQKHAVDPVRQKVVHPFRQRRVVEQRDRLLVIGSELERSIQTRPARTQQLRQPVLGKAEIQPHPRFGLWALRAPAFVDAALALVPCSSARHPAD